MGRLFASASNEYLSTAISRLTGIPLTIFCWFKRTGSPTEIMCEAGAGGHRFRLWWYDVGQIVYQIRDSGTTNLPTSVASTANIWQSACGVSHSTTDHRVFLNGGNKATSGATRNPNAPTNIYIGDGNPLSDPWNGALAEVAIWSTGLLDEEVAYLANNKSPLLVRPGNLVLYTRLLSDEDFDIIGGHQFTPNGTPTITDHPPIAYPPGAVIAERSVIDPYYATEARRRRFLIKSSAPVSEIDGTANLAITTSADIAATGEIIGSASIAITTTGDVKGDGALTGSPSLAITTTSSIDATADLIGSSALAITTSGIISATGEVIGSGALAITTTGVLTSPGAMQGTAALVLTVPSTAINATGEVVGSPALAITTSSTIAASAAIIGSSALALTTSADLEKFGAISASGDLVLTTSGILSATGELIGAPSLAITTTGALATIGEIIGTADIALTTSGVLAAAVVIGPYDVQAQEVFVPGAASAEVYVPGAIAAGVDV